MTDKVKKKKGSLLSKLKKRKTRSLPTLTRRADRLRAELSFSQQRLWFVEQLYQGDPTQNIPFRFELDGPCDAAALEAALRALFQRHEALRACLQDSSDQVMMRIHETLAFSLQLLDFTDMSVPASVIETFACKLFNLFRAPLQRIALVRTSSRHHLLMINMHHLVFDGWSHTLFRQELAAFYAKQVTGKPHSLAPLTLGYGDFSQWQRANKGESQRELEYWSKQLAAVPSLEMATDKPRPQLASQDGDYHRFQITPTLMEQIRAVTRQTGVTVYAFCMALYQLLLSRYSNQRDFAIGTTVANRIPRETETMIGLFINSLAIRTSLKGKPSFAGLLKQVSATSLAAFTHQKVPFELVIEHLQPERDAGRTPLFQVLLSLLSGEHGSDVITLPGMRARQQMMGTHTAKFDLSLIMRESSKLECVLEFRRDLFLRTTIERIADQFVWLAEQAVSDPERSLTNFQVLRDSDQKRLLNALSSTLPLPQTTSLHGLFSERIAERGGRLAIRQSGQSLTYAELAHQSDKLAQQLYRRGTRPGDPVGLSLPRGFPMIIGLLAIVKLGAAYVPLNAETPLERLFWLVDHVGIKTILSNEDLADLLEPVCEQVICIEEIDLTEGSTIVPSDGNLGPNAACYILFTSGTTGLPKAVVTPHRGVIRLLEGQTYVPITDRDIVLQTAPIEFDVSTFEIWGSLLAGATLSLMPAGPLSLTGIAEEIHRQKVTILWLTAQLFHAMVDEQREAFARVRILFAGGDVLSPIHVKTIKKRYPQLRLVNGYGPTEATSFATTHEVRTADFERASVPIGRPILNTSAQLVDADLNLVAEGVPGELLLGGPGLALGYWTDPVQTALSFVPNPWGEAGTRLYRSGDLASLQPPTKPGEVGALSFQGRTDQQVKIRGYRIELGEIVTRLEAHPLVNQAAVLVRLVSADKQLVAYLTFVPGAEPHLIDRHREILRAALVETLPVYMVPAAFVVLSEMPATENGKLDRAALREPIPTDFVSSTKQVAPRDENEQEIAQIWKELLGLEEIGVHDNFFQLGGHSLLATRMVTVVSKAFTVPLSLATFFAQPSISEMNQEVIAAQMSLAGTPPPIEPAPTRQPLPLSFAQNRLWFVDQLKPGDPAYNIPLAFRLEGPFKAPVFEQAFTALVERHQVMRSAFLLHDNEPSQVVMAATRCYLEYEDLRTLEDQETILAERMQQEAERCFSLTDPPLYHLSLFQLAEENFVLLINQHHIITDSRSLAVMFTELSELYQAADEQRASSLAPLTIQYADFAYWQRTQTDYLNRQIAYWEEHLVGIEGLGFPCDFPMPRSPSGRGAYYRFDFPQPLSQELLAMSQRLGVTPYMLMLAIFQIVLGRYTGQSDVALGTPIANRNHDQIEHMLGFFINTLVMRGQLESRISFREHLLRVRDNVVGAYQHQDAPFDTLVERLHPDREQGGTLVKVLLGFQNAIDQNAILFPLAGIKTSQEFVTNHTAKFDFTLNLWEQGGRLHGGLEYSLDLYKRETIDRLVPFFLYTAEQAVAEPDLQLGAFPTALPHEIQTQLQHWNENAHPFPKEATLHELYQEQATLRPAAVAVVDGGVSMTYGELDEQSDRLAQHLLGLGVRPDQMVAICMPGSSYWIISVLAVLKAGAGYLPLDPEHPIERLIYMLEDAGAQLILGSGLEQLGLLDLIAYIDPSPLCREEPRHPCTLPRVSPQQLAYIIYTSGSTGQPKGVAQSHRSVVSLAMNERIYAITPGMCIAQSASTSFDASVWEVWACLLNGARLVIIPKYVLLNSEDFGIVLIREQIQAIWLTTALFNYYAQNYPMLLALPKIIHFGGEAADPDAVRALFEVCEPPYLINSYGPTECTVFTHQYQLRKPDLQLPSLPIGQPLHNVSAFVLDQQLRPLPIGVVGRLFVGEYGLARGYFNQPSQTAERFLPNPFGQPGERIYHTGDLVRFLSSGDLVFVGRVDNQVKIRGFRIEPDEIARSLEKLDQVKQACVITYGRTDSLKIAAYVVAQGEEGEREALHQQMSEQLPDFMIPDALIFLDQFPLNVNGKLDLKALPEPETGVTHRHPEDNAPLQGLEQEIAQMFGQLLGMEQVGRHDNFFDLGGHSLLLTQLAAQIQETHAIAVPLGEFFETPTVVYLCDLIAQADPSSGTSMKILPVSRDQALPLSCAQQRLWFLDRLEPGNPNYNMPLAFRIEGNLKSQRLERAFKQVVSRHEILRTSLHLENNQPLQHIHREARLAYQTVDLSTESHPESALTSWLVQVASYNFDLSELPLFQVYLFKLAQQTTVMLVNLHHIICDGWSLSILFQELAAYYRAESQGVSPDLEQLPIQYADFASWQQAWLKGPELAAQLAYWEQRLKDLDPPEIPFDRPRPSQPSRKGGMVRFQLDEHLSQALKQLAQDHKATLFMALLAVFQILQYRYTRQTDVSTGVAIANRNKPEILNLIGFFVNTLIIRTHLQPSAEFATMFRSLRHQVLADFSNQDAPFDRVVERLLPERDLAVPPLARSMFTLQNAQEDDTAVLPLPEMQTRQEYFTTQTSKFDLVLSFREQDHQLMGAIEYNTDIYNQATLKQFAEHYRRLAHQICDDPSQSLERLSLLTAGEEARLLAEWQRSDPFPEHSAAPARFTAMARKYTDRVALVEGQQRLTYHQLRQAAEKIARHLLTRGVRPDEIVGICLERSIKLVETMLGVMMAAAAYLPMDTEHPAERRAFMLDNAKVRYCLGNRAGSEGGVTYLDVNALATEEVAPCKLPLISARHAAYVIYTSGSTGTPKGVITDHRALLRVAFNKALFPIDEQLVCSQIFSCSFDGSTSEIWVSLLNGGRLVIIDRQTSLDAPALRHLLKEEQVNTLHLPTALLHFYATHHPRILSRIRSVVFGGEKLEVGPIRNLLAYRKPTHLINGYGPTEATVFATVYQIQESDRKRTDIPIGRPISNTRVYVLDPQHQPVPKGVCGELYLAGPGLSRGYVADPALTAERFLPDPFHRQGERMYRTGDIVRNVEGQLTFIGRRDTQLKIRGYRIEPIEIARRLEEHPTVLQAFVQPFGPTDNLRLAAYLVGEQLPASHTLSAFLANKLPSYMLPDAYEKVASLPLSINGKVDPRQLPEPSIKLEVGRQHRPPRNTLEVTLSALWSQVLGTEVTSIDLDFFAIGGNSLTSARLAAAIQEKMQRLIPLQRIFEHNTIARFAAWYRESEAQADPSNKILPVSRNQILPLSFAQQRMWFLDRLDPGNSSYNMPLAFRIQGGLNSQRMERAYKQLILRHEILRTSHHLEDNQPLQRIHQEAVLTFQNVDLSGEPQPETELKTRLTQAASISFDLSELPLFRVHLYKLPRQTTVMLVNLHHIICDGWSLSIFFQELAVYYRADTLSLKADLEPLPIQYADFSCWQQQWAKGPEHAAQLAYWEQRLKGLEPPEIPYDRPRPTVTQKRSGVVNFQIEQHLTQELKQVARAHSVTQFMIVLAVFQALQSRYTGQDDVSAGVVVANRNKPEMHHLIGFFVNTLVIRTKLEPEADFTSLLSSLRHQIVRDLSNQDAPFDTVVERLLPNRDIAVPPLTRAMFTLQNAQEDDAAVLPLPEMKTQPEYFPTQTAKFDLSFSLREHDHQLRGTIEFNREIYDESTLQQLAQHYIHLAQQYCADPKQSLQRVTLLSAEEKQRMVVEWNRTESLYPEQSSVPAVFADTARKYADSIALVDGRDQISYRQLQQRAEKLARQLLKRGVRPDQVVGLCLPRSSQLIEAMIGVMIASAAYLPMDTEHPPERRAYMLNNAGARYCISDWTGTAAEVTYLKADTLAAEEVPALELPIVSPRHTAYVIYTSGSTGRPKGVPTEHRALLRLATSKAIFPIDERLVASQIFSSSFDGSSNEIWPALLNGGRLVIVDKQTTLDADALECLLEEQQVNTLHLPTALLHFYAAHHPQIINRVKHVLFGGEKLEIGPLRNLLAHGKPDILINGYGPTESTSIATVYPIREEDQQQTDIPIGGPMSNTRVYVLDRQIQPVPVKVSGELYIAGPGLTRGYVADPVLTAQRFLPDPYNGIGERMYRSGDIVRYLGQNKLVFSGRRDEQLKIRGYRIEPIEIVRCLEEHASVRQAVVHPFGPAGNLRLAAYLVTDQTPDIKELSTYLAGKLPRYMVPDAYERIDSLPLNINGKVDHQQLPEPSTERIITSRDRAPRDSLETKLTELWTGLLGREVTHIDDDFFALGGNSLLTARLAALIQEEMQRRIPLNRIFEHPTVASFADWYRTQGEESLMFSLRQGQQHPPLILIHPFEGNAECYRPLSAQLEGPIYGINHPYTQGKESGQSIQALAQQYLPLIRAQQAKGPYLLGGWSMGGVIAYELASSLTEAGERVQVVMLDSYAPNALEASTPLATDGELTHWAERAGLIAKGQQLPDDLHAMLRANQVAVRNYVPDKQEIEVLLFKAQDNSTPVQHPQSNGWQPCLGKGLRVELVPGNHWQVLQEPALTIIATMLAQHRSQENQLKKEHK